MNDIHVNLLIDAPEHGEKAIEWIYSTWGSDSGKDLESLKKKAENYKNIDRLPIMFVATQNSSLAGFVILCENDMRGKECYSPWLASLFVAPEYRNRGIASMLERSLIDKALSLGMKTVYLFTSDSEEMYKKIGWQFLEKTVYRGEDVSIMFKNTAR